MYHTLEQDKSHLLYKENHMYCTGQIILDV